MSQLPVPTPLVTGVYAGGLSILAFITDDTTANGFSRAITDPVFGRIQATVTVEEDQQDELEITEHPIENGAAIADHAYKRPAVLSLNVGWSESDAAANGDPQYIQRIYDTMLAIQAGRQPLVVTTYNRLYRNLLIKSLRTRRDKKTAHVLFLQMSLREIIIVETVSIAVSLNPATQATPDLTAPPLNTGPQQLQDGDLYNDTGLVHTAPDYTDLSGFHEVTP